MIHKFTKIFINFSNQCFQFIQPNSFNSVIASEISSIVSGNSSKRFPFLRNSFAWFCDSFISDFNRSTALAKSINSELELRYFISKASLIREIIRNFDVAKRLFFFCLYCITNSCRFLHFSVENSRSLEFKRENSTTLSCGRI
ncbi:hypothetical protein DERP_012852 [Dermatophagoides pteronyssinus]|uniref:Uncharacterized protein n=1 Tax=Dermatophagoides pteronyssinus TaxID=6956 RepID=A0ABQ8J1L0_DERPT|nr:hypothetical protein DERP_012852 [Dermatophagoides pteronyssinus]